jgi:4-hydroxy-2-oxoheptanedioate aldolase
MRQSIVKRKLGGGEPVFVVKTVFCTPDIVEMMGIFGFDVVWICNEHLGIDPSAMRAMLCAARAGNIDTVVRTGPHSEDDYIRYLEMGATGLMIPHVQTADEARAIVSAIKFQPVGRRGFDGVSADAAFGATPMMDYMRAANEQTFVVVQIEDVAAIYQIEEIARVEGVDVVFVGPADLSIDMGIPGQIRDPRILEVIQRVARACEGSGAVCGTWGGEPQYAKMLLDLGVRYITGLSDNGLLRKGFQSWQKDFEAVGFHFRKQ